jgi:integrase
VHYCLNPGVYMASTRSPNQSVKLTKTVVEKLPSPPAGQAFHRDSELKGFAVRVTAAGVKSFIVEKRINGKVVRATLARFGELTVEQARKKAQSYLGMIAMGGDPVGDKQRAALRSATLDEAFAAFKTNRQSLKPHTLYNYGRLLASAFPDWRGRALTAISKDMVAKRHLHLSDTRGEAYADLAMRFLRSLINFSIAHYEDRSGNPVIPDNPVLRLTRTRAWNRTERRQTWIKLHQLKAWCGAVDALRTESSPSAETIADYLLFLLFSGLRRQEAAQLTWDQIDLIDRTLVIPDPKNRRPHTLPLSTVLVEILSRRRTHATSRFVFPGDGASGYLVEPKRQIAKVVSRSGVEFTIHDLRRTFVTVAESCDVPPYAIKRLVNHAMRNDVTAGYIVTDVERLRGPIQRICDRLVNAAGMHGLPLTLVSAQSG